ncbi:SDR family oxidoreductase [Dehalogenimonas etheniformans]|uniref:SDR family oxidoreductase n=1 Tax=Dehalogenimonas etheniformans TaxID=1536648 RepID=UPI00167F83AB|nr:SDR family oxidoreductase [Dehalogenimonas etheniformans]QNT76164.1 SDR family oxidoreductase [Dehalogenimonas etheniformans]
MKMVVTGGAGFIGSHLAEALSQKGEVVIIDNLSTGKFENIAQLLNRDNITFVEGSIMDLEMLRRQFSDAHFVFHQAAIPNVVKSIEDPISTNDTNIRGTLNVLVAAKDCGVSKVVFASSSSVYGDTLELPKKESMQPNPKSPYALTKRVGEEYCRIFSQVYGLSTVSLRYFNVYGLRQRADSAYAAVIPQFVERIKHGSSPVIYGDGKQTRDFTYVKDVVEANILAAERAENGVYNIGSGSPISILELAGRINAIFGRNILPEFQAPRKGDVRDSLASIDSAGSFGYHPKYNLEKGLREMITGG